MLYVALDPGKSTGYVSYQYGQILELLTIDDFNFDFLMNKFLNVSENDVTIITERYRVYPGMQANQALQEMWAPKINGALMLLVKIRNLEGKNWVLKEQWSSSAKQYATDQMLKDKKMYKGTRHAKDAIRHLLLALYDRDKGK